MKPLLLLLALSCPIVAQTIKPVEKNIDQCFKHSSKTPEAFDLCVKYEFDRVKDENRMAELRATDPPGTFHCDLSNTSSKNLSRCFDAQLVRLNEARERLYSTPGYVPSHFPSYRYPAYYPHYYPRTYYPRSYYPAYPTRFLFPLTPLRSYRRY